MDSAGAADRTTPGGAEPPGPAKLPEPPDRPAMVGRFLLSFLIVVGCFAVIVTDFHTEDTAAAFALLVLIVNVVLAPASRT